MNKKIIFLMILSLYAPYIASMTPQGQYEADLEAAIAQSLAPDEEEEQMAAAIARSLIPEKEEDDDLQAALMASKAESEREKKIREKENQEKQEALEFSIRDTPYSSYQTATESTQFNEQMEHFNFENETIEKIAIYERVINLINNDNWFEIKNILPQEDYQTFTDSIIQQDKDLLITLLNSKITDLQKELTILPMGLHKINILCQNAPYLVQQIVLAKNLRQTNNLTCGFNVLYTANAINALITKNKNITAYDLSNELVPDSSNTAIANNNFWKDTKIKTIELSHDDFSHKINENNFSLLNPAANNIIVLGFNLNKDATNISDGFIMSYFPEIWKNDMNAFVKNTLVKLPFLVQLKSRKI